jgi:pimeloyl-ACP methyl ester carboxylesterase
VYKYGDVYQRAGKLKVQLDNIIRHSGASKINLITHSMGGLDARHYITHLGGHRHISSMTSIATPHRGSSFADLYVSTCTPLLSCVIPWCTLLRSCFFHSLLVSVWVVFSHTSHTLRPIILPMCIHQHKYKRTNKYTHIIITYIYYI